MTIEKLRIALLGAITALAMMACGGQVPSNSAVPNDDAATNNPETNVPRDASSPPPDVAPRDDAGTPTPDAATPVDAAVTPDAPAPTDVATPPPPVDTGMPFNRATCDRLRTRNWLISGSTERADTIGCIISLTTGMGTLDIPPEIAASMGEFTGTCSGNSCTVGDCRWVDLSPTMISFRAICGSREFSIITL